MLTLRLGSSPLMRGVYGLPGLDASERGIIPAHAGSIPRGCEGRALTWDHPRSCGEYTLRCYRLMHNRGSSPLMRGVSSLSIRNNPFVGIIPAHAGSILYQKQGIEEFGDHPRSCGEYSLRQNEGSGFKGSSPLMRGVSELKF